jgi:transposase InsO family protein
VAECWTKYPELRHKRNDKANSAVEEKQVVIMAMDSKASTQATSWKFDSGATSHISSTREAFKSYSPLPQRRRIQIANGNTIYGIGTGTVELRALVASQVINLVLTDVLYVPDCAMNLISLFELQDKGVDVMAKGRIGNSVPVVTAERNGKTLFTAFYTQGAYELRLDRRDNSEYANAAIQKSPEAAAKVWHGRLGHSNMRAVRELASGLATGIPTNLAELKDHFCDSCALGKAHRQPSRMPATRATRKLELIHTDICGPFPRSQTGKQYMLLFKDDYTRFTWIYLLQYKSEVFQSFREFHAMVERESSLGISRIRSDNGGEYVSNAMATYLRKHGIQHERTARYGPEQNGIAERANRTLQEKVRAMRIGAGLPVDLWGEVMSTAVYIGNRLPTKSLVKSTPYEAYTGSKLDISNL